MYDVCMIKTICGYANICGLGIGKENGRLWLMRKIGLGMEFFDPDINHDLNSAPPPL